MNLNQKLLSVISTQPHPLLFATLSGAHLYGFPSPDSDYDFRGSHILPVQKVIGLEPGPETIEVSEIRDSIELDLVTHDIKKFFEMLLKKNGYVLEQLYSPLVIHTTAEHEELKAIAKQCITRYHAHHYLGFSRTQWKLFQKMSPFRVKPLLYVYRVLLTGIHLMKTGEIETNLVKLNEVFQLPYIPDLIARKLAGAEKSVLEDTNLNFHEGE
ncbi:MAG: nucleotidyltransferase, partial [Moorea sp. SIO4G2]|nr:nucleotidyltransferase [Moorena sp. SIO4G2]